MKNPKTEEMVVSTFPFKHAKNFKTKLCLIVAVDNDGKTVTNLYQEPAAIALGLLEAALQTVTSTLRPAMLSPAPSRPFKGPEGAA